MEMTNKENGTMRGSKDYEGKNGVEMEDPQVKWQIQKRRWEWQKNF